METNKWEHNPNYPYYHYFFSKGYVLTMNYGVNVIAIYFNKHASNLPDIYYTTITGNFSDLEYAKKQAFIALKRGLKEYVAKLTTVYIEASLEEIK